MRSIQEAKIAILSLKNKKIKGKIKIIIEYSQFIELYSPVPKDSDSDFDFNMPIYEGERIEREWKRK